jgi:hypothetical protein
LNASCPGAVVYVIDPVRGDAADPSSAKMHIQSVRRLVVVGNCVQCHFLPSRIGPSAEGVSRLLGEWIAGQQRLIRQQIAKLKVPLNGFGSNLYRLGVPDIVIQRILRHANVSTTSG